MQVENEKVVCILLIVVNTYHVHFTSLVWVFSQRCCSNL